MPPERPLLPTSDQRYQILVTDDGSFSLMDTVLDESYHSGSGAAAESYIVYLHNSRAESLICQPASNGLRVLEYGFGTAMNFILTASLALSKQVPLYYESWEYRLLPSAVFELLNLPSAVASLQHYNWLIGCEPYGTHVTQKFLHFRNSLENSSQSSALLNIDDLVTLKLNLGNATQYSPHQSTERFDTIYFDAFSPKTNPDLWTPEVLSAAYNSLRDNGTLVTYCVNSAVRKLVSEVGFRVTKAPGPPKGKREVLIAFRDSL